MNSTPVLVQVSLIFQNEPGVGTGVVNIYQTTSAWGINEKKHVPLMIPP